MWKHCKVEVDQKYVQGPNCLRDLKVLYIFKLVLYSTENQCRYEAKQQFL